MPLLYSGAKVQHGFRNIAAAAVALLIATTAGAQDAHPNLSGTWTMDSGKSEQGPLTPQSMSMVVEQNGDQFNITRDVTTQAGQAKSTTNYTVDGKPYKNTVKQGNGGNVDVTSVLSWEGSSLIVKNTLMQMGQEIHQTDKYTLGADGKTLTIDRSVDVQGQTLSGRLVMVKS